MSEALLDTSTTIEVKNPEFRSIVQESALEQLPDYLEQVGLATGRAFIITDSNVRKLYGEFTGQVLADSGVESAMLSIPAGEEHKTLEQVARLVDELSESGATRSDVIVALGGGVVGDLGGFVASIYNRGVSLVQVPTTLLAMVDSSIGGKTGVDHGGKNKTGSFYQPRLVVADPLVLETLDQRIYNEGFGEIVKYGMLDAPFFDELEELAPRINRFSKENLQLIGRVIARSVEQKSTVISNDPFEKAPDGRILLNYGHTLGHGLEAAGGYTELLHGEGVGIGMTFAACLAVHLELADAGLLQRQTRLLEEFDLPTHYAGAAVVSEVMRHIGKDKKNTKSQSTRFVLPKAAGNMVVQQIFNNRLEPLVEEFLDAKWQK